jgi:predicted acylesterase/phospholipase RssA
MTERRTDEDLKDLREHSAYQDARLLCDVVMKGGITSGVTYPWAICEIAKQYRLRNVGGTSAGAIAAAAAAAAEVGRQAVATAEKNGQQPPDAGFVRLAKLPTRLSQVSPGQTNSVLFNMFQPSDATKPFFRILTAGLRAKKSRIKQALMVPAAVLRSAPIAAILGSLPGLLAIAWLLTLDVTHDALRSDGVAVTGIVFGLLAGLLAAVVGSFIAVAARLITRGLRAIGDNGFGICMGFVPAKVGEPELLDGDLEIRDGRHEPKPLTTWLTDEIDALAGRDTTGDPLTLNDLAKAGVNLKMFTTNLTEGTPYTLPFFMHDFYFDPDTLARYFPKRVVAWMVGNRPAITGDDAARYEVAKAQNDRLVPFPDAANVPVVVMTRFSLSFPVLLSAVPLWRVYDDEDTGQPVARECWFSDGGITSNFPIHFFDSPLPRWPTFGINLGPAGPGGLGSDQQRNIWAPMTNDQGAVPRWAAITGLVGFGKAIADTMQNWMDNSQTKVPGYRDRIVLVRHSKEEGGMNLNMPEEFISALATRGRFAGRFLVDRFSGERSHNAGPDGASDELSWENHRWVRFRSVMTLIEGLHAGLVRGVDWSPFPAKKTYPNLVQDPPSYGTWRDDEQQARVQAVIQELVALARDWSEMPEPPTPPRGPADPATIPNPKLAMTPPPGQEPFDRSQPFQWGAPRPRPALRIVRDF